MGVLREEAHAIDQKVEKIAAERKRGGLPFKARLQSRYSNLLWPWFSKYTCINRQGGNEVVT
jgi:hypothetical protein